MAYSRSARDTSTEAAALQVQALQRLPGEARLRLAFEMSMTARSLLRARLVREHPDWPPGEVERGVLRCLVPDLPLPPAWP